jgi:hypothetical protein
VSGSGATGHASERQLRALARTFGLGGARELALRSERPLREALSGLAALLAAHEPVLARLHSLLQACAAVTHLSLLFPIVLSLVISMGWCDGHPVSWERAKNPQHWRARGVAVLW